MSGGGRPPVYLTRASCTRMSVFGTVARVPGARRRRGPSTKIGDLEKFEPFGGVGVYVIVVEGLGRYSRNQCVMPAALAMVLLILGSFADHLLSEHTPFTVTVLHPLELDHSRFFHSLRSLQLPFRLDALATRCHVLRLRSRFPPSARKRRLSKNLHELYVRTTGGKDCAEYPQHTSRTDTESACGGRPRSLERAYAEWAWSGAAGARRRYPQARDEDLCPSQL
jgi:hypothetical protein